MIDNLKLQNLAVNLSHLQQGEVKTPTDAFAYIVSLNLKFPDYFTEYLGLKNLIKLSIFYWSYKKTNDFNLAAKILSNLQFLVLFSHSDETYVRDCDDCYSDGYVTCSHCEGTGTERCDECSGEGEIRCDNCDGEGVEECGDCDGTGQEGSEEDGEIDCINCNGKGQVICSECDGVKNIECGNCSGSGDVDCYYCDGRATEICDTCNGNGQIETEEKIYWLDYLVSWSPTLNSLSENTTSTSPILNVESLIDYENDYMKTAGLGEDNHMEIFDEISPDKVYVVDSNDDPVLFNYHGRIIWSFPDDSLDKFGYNV